MTTICFLLTGHDNFISVVIVYLGRLLKDKGHFFGRFNPGSRVGHTDPVAEGVSFFPWSKSYLRDLCYEYNLDIIEILNDNARIYFHGKKIKPIY